MSKQKLVIAIISLALLLGGAYYFLYYYKSNTRTQEKVNNGTAKEMLMREGKSTFGRIANLVHHGEKVFSAFFFPGPPNPISIPFYTRHPAPAEKYDWTDAADINYALKEMTEAGINTIQLSWWGFNKEYELWSPTLSSPEVVAQTFKFAKDHNILVAPLLEVSPKFMLYEEFPNNLSNMIGRIEYLLTNFGKNSNWLQLYDKEGKKRYVIWLIETIHSNPGDGVTPQTFAQGFAKVAQAIKTKFSGKGDYEIGFIIDPTPLPAGGTYFGPEPEALASEPSILAVNPFNITSDGQTENDRINKAREILKKWRDSSIPLMPPILPGFDDHLVRPPGVIYGENSWWREQQIKLALDYETAGVSIDIWNGFTEGYATVPTIEYGRVDYDMVKEVIKQIKYGNGEKIIIQQENKQHLGILADPGSMNNSLLTEAGVKWINAGLWPQAKGYFDIPQVKSRVTQLKDNNFNVLINFGIATGEDHILHTFMNQGNNDRWQRGDLIGYYAWLNDVVKNLSFDYKGEPATIYYQMGTELEGPDWWPASKNGSVEDYAIMLRLAYKAMKEFNPKLQLLLSGSYLTDMAWGGAEEGLRLERAGRNYYLRVLDELVLMESIEKNPATSNKYRSNPYISEEEYKFLFAKDNYARYFDAVDFHPSGDEKQDLEIPEQTSLIFGKLKEKGYPKLPLWITDVNDVAWPGPECKYPTNNEEAHSRTMIKRYITSRAYGAETFMWTTFVNYPAGDVIAKCTGLVDPSDKLGEIKKRKAFYSYKLIADKIDFKEKSDIIKDGKTDNIFVYKFSEENQAPVYTAWHYNPSGSSKEKQVQINTGFNKAKIINMIPIDNDGNFQSWTQDAPGGIITLTLTNDPYLIEQIN